MKKYVFVSFLAIALLAGIPSMAQEKKEKEKEKMGESDEIIIKRKGDKDSKVIVEIKDGEVIVNGKPIDDYDDENISIHRRSTPRVHISTNGSAFRMTEPRIRMGNNWNYSGDGEDAALAYTISNKAFLGVASENADGGAKIISVTEKSAAEKAGLKKGDLITKLGDTKIGDPADLSKAVGARKPDEKVVITYKRAGKEYKTTATLGKNNTTAYGRSYGIKTPGEFYMPEAMEPMEGFNFNWNDNHNDNLFGDMGRRPRLGIKAQDTEDGKGVKVLEVSKESLAEKSGIKEGDIITEFDGKEINSADELAEAAQESREKSSVKVQVSREGKSQSIEIKIPKKLKTANL